MSQSLRVGIVGVGKMGCLHLEKFKSLPEVEVAGIYDASVEQCKNISARYQVPMAASFADLIFDCDALVVASWTSSHFELAKRALDAGVHLLIEKPMTETVEQAESLTALAEKLSLIVQVGYLERVRVGKLLRLRPGETIQWIEARRHLPNPGREAGLDAIQDLMVHDLDLVLHLVGEYPSRVQAQGATWVSRSLDVASVHLSFPGGAEAVLSVNRACLQQERSLSLLTNERAVRVDLLQNRVDERSRELGSAPQRALEKQSIDALLEQAKIFIQAIKEKKGAVANASASVRTQILLGEIERTLRVSGKALAPEKERTLDS